ncbi:MAG: hypothetical protein WAV18_26305 [Roseiarcus sp.]
MRAIAARLIPDRDAAAAPDNSIVQDERETSDFRRQILGRVHWPDGSILTLFSFRFSHENQYTRLATIVDAQPSPIIGTSRSQ